MVAAVALGTPRVSVGRRISTAPSDSRPGSTAVYEEVTDAAAVDDSVALGVFVCCAADWLTSAWRPAESGCVSLEIRLVSEENEQLGPDQPAKQEQGLPFHEHRPCPLQSAISSHRDEQF